MENKTIELYRYFNVANYLIFFALLVLILLLTSCGIVVTPHTHDKFFISKNRGWPYTNPDLPQAPELLELQDSHSGQNINHGFILIIEYRHSIETSIAGGAAFTRQSYRVHTLPFSEILEFKSKAGNKMGFLWSYRAYGVSFEGYAFARGYVPVHLTKSNKRFFIDTTQVSLEEFKSEMEQTPDRVKKQFHKNIETNSNRSTRSKVDDRYYTILCDFPSRINLEPYNGGDRFIIEHLVRIAREKIKKQYQKKVELSIRKKLEQLLEK